MTERAAPKLSAKGLEAHTTRTDNLQYSAPTLDSAEPAKAGATTATATSNEPGRNAPCPCGSGKKYKRCHGAPAGAN
ncbi:MAG TPA: SEC-C metal-binding domain-containing protein [Mycobacteriales bacterium]|nr:SEC-C metal-binding domain-containing protein [Mycobacteriales bacterium]